MEKSIYVDTFGRFPMELFRIFYSEFVSDQLRLFRIVCEFALSVHVHTLYTANPLCTRLTIRYL